MKNTKIQKRLCNLLFLSAVVILSVSSQVFGQQNTERRPDVCAAMFLTDYVAKKKITSWDLYALREFNKKGIFPQNEWGLPDDAAWQKRTKALLSDFKVFSEDDIYLYQDRKEKAFQNVRAGDLLVIADSTMRYGGVMVIREIYRDELEIVADVYNDENGQITRQNFPLSLDPKTAELRFIRPWITIVRLKNNKYCLPETNQNGNLNGTSPGTNNNSSNSSVAGQSTQNYKIDPTLLDKYAGQYQYREDKTILNIERGDNSLFLYSNNAKDKKTQWLPESDDTFFKKGNQNSVERMRFGNTLSGEGLAVELKVVGFIYRLAKIADAKPDSNDTNNNNSNNSADSDEDSGIEVKMTAQFNKSIILPGETVEVNVLLNIPSQKFIFSATPKEPLMIPTRLKVSSTTPSVKIGNVIYPRAESSQVLNNGKPWDIYRNRVEMKFNVSIPKNFNQETLRLNLLLSYLLMTDEVTYPPKRIEITISSEVQATGTKKQ